MKSSRAFFASVVLLVGALRIASAQTSIPPVRLVFAGDEWEQYLRVLQLAGSVPAYPWSVRAFGPRELDSLAPRDTLHPWHGRLPNQSHAFRALQWSVVPLEVQTIYNSGFPYGSNDGAIWAGRGFTGAIQGGIAARLGPLSATLAPIAFSAQNTAFPLENNGFTGRLAFADGNYPSTIDLPQRFGDKAYSRLDPGQSTIRIDVGPFAAGFSSANEVWGPAVYYPLILGNNAPGFPHVFVGTSTPLNLWLVQLHGRLIWGKLDQSDYADTTGAATTRFASAAVGTMTIRGAPGLEIGAARFFHLPWPTGGIPKDYLFRPFQGVVKQSLSTATNPSGDDASDNQLASVFFRWAFPGNGIEVYGEFGREDYNYSLRDLWGQIDHDGAYTIGLQRVWKRPGGSFAALHGEILNSRVSHLNQGLEQTVWYVHSVSDTQGHTEDGQILGSPAAFGGFASTIALDIYSQSGRTTFQLAREARAQLRIGSGGFTVDEAADVLGTVSVERAEFVRPGMEITFGATGVLDQNRNFTYNAFNTNIRLGARLTQF